MYEKEIQSVQAAVEALRSEGKLLLIQELEQEQSAAATGLEYYGITKVVLRRFLRNKDLTNATRAAIRNAIAAVVTM